MNNADLRQLADKIVADANDARVDDTAFRRRARRNAARMQKLLSAPGAGRSAASAARYAFVAVPNGSGGTTSVSIVRDTFDELARTLGGRAEVAALARKVAVGHRPDSGMSRSAYVLRRLRQRAQRAFEKASRAAAGRGAAAPAAPGRERDKG